LQRRSASNGFGDVNALNEFGHGGVMYGWRARIGNISPTACSEILPYEFYRVAPEGVTFVSTNLVIRDARESSQVEASWRKFDTAFEDLLHTLVDHITLSGAPLVLRRRAILIPSHSNLNGLFGQRC
jgi:hypothetical protein